MLNALRKTIKYLHRSRVSPDCLQIEVTNHCNFHCIMCPFHRPDNPVMREKGMMSLEIYRKILKDYKQMGGKFVIPQGAGEPFLHPDILEMIAIARKKYGFKVGITTNGSLVTQDQLEQLITLDIQEIGFSIDAGTESTFRKICGEGGLSQIEQKVEFLMRQKTKRKCSNPLVRVLLVSQAENQAEIEHYCERWIACVDEVVIQTERTDSGRRLAQQRLETRRPCQHLFKSLFVQWNGDVVVCCEDWNSETIVGNAINDSLKTVWYSEVMSGYRAAQKSNVFDPPPICRDCQAWSGGQKRKTVKNNLVIEETALTVSIRRKKF